MPIVNGESITYRQMRKRNLAYLRESIDILAARFGSYDMVYEPVPGSPDQTYFPWYGRPDEEIMVCLFAGRELHETFHRHDFFFFNFAYEGDYQTLSYTPDNLLTVHEGELYLGQPYTGYALRGNREEDVKIAGVLVRKETFFNSFLPVAQLNDEVVRFFIDPLGSPEDERFVILHPGLDFPIRSILDLMICEYAHERPDTQSLLKSYALLLITYTARQFELERPPRACAGPLAEMLSYMEGHVGDVSLKQLAQRFGYHPNYLSTLFKNELGKSFTQVVLEQRMRRAQILLRASDLPVEQIAFQLGYSDPSNFYKAFSRFYGCTPREYARAQRG